MHHDHTILCQQDRLNWESHQKWFVDKDYSLTKIQIDESTHSQIYEFIQTDENIEDQRMRILNYSQNL